MTGPGGAGFHWSPCLPAHSALAGWQVWVGVPVAGYLAWRILGPVVVLGPLAVVAAVVAIVVTVRVVRRRRTARRLAALPVTVSVLTTARPGRVGSCAGCGWRMATGALVIAGDLIPACAPCRQVAVKRLTTGRAALPSARPGLDRGWLSE